MAAPAPGVHGEPDAAFYRTIALIAARMPLLLPAHQVGGDGKLFFVDGRARARYVQVLGEELQRVHVELVRQVIERAHGNDRSLRVIRRTPGARRSLVGAHRGVLLALVGNFEHVGNWRRARARRPARAPGIRLPGHYRAVALGAYLYAGES